jgi:hypothetical protein
MISQTHAQAQNPQRNALIQECNDDIKSIKLWDYEGIKLDFSGSFKHHICLTADCNPFVSWDFFIKNLDTIEVTKYEEYDAIRFSCILDDCIVPTGYEKGGRYEPKSNLYFMVKDVEKAKILVDKLKKLKGKDF